MNNPLEEARLRFRIPKPLLGEIVIFPVELPPNVKAWLLVVCIVAVELSSVRLPETDAVCNPLTPLTLSIANLAETELCPPIRKSSVELFANIAPKLSVNGVVFVSVSVSVPQVKRRPPNFHLYHMLRA